MRPRAEAVAEAESPVEAHDDAPPDQDAPLSRSWTSRGAMKSPTSRSKLVSGRRRTVRRGGPGRTPGGGRGGRSIRGFGAAGRCPGRGACRRRGDAPEHGRRVVAALAEQLQLGPRKLDRRSRAGHAECPGRHTGDTSPLTALVGAASVPACPTPGPNAGRATAGRCGEHLGSARHREADTAARGLRLRGRGSRDRDEPAAFTRGLRTGRVRPASPP